MAKSLGEELAVYRKRLIETRQKEQKLYSSFSGEEKKKHAVKLVYEKCIIPAFRRIGLLYPRETYFKVAVQRCKTPILPTYEYLAYKAFLKNIWEGDWEEITLKNLETKEILQMAIEEAPAYGIIVRDNQRLECFELYSPVIFELKYAY